MTLVLILIGGGAGAVARWLITHLVATAQQQHGERAKPAFPLGTAVVNVLGSFLIGLAVGIAGDTLSAGAEPLTVGVVGGFTTFSTWMVEADRAKGAAATAAVLTIPSILGFAAATAGLAIGKI